MKMLVRFCFLFLAVHVTAANALNIVLTNDDSWNTRNINVLKAQLEEAGHDVIMSAPCAAQSGKGGAMTLFRPLPVNDIRANQDEYCVGDTDASKLYRDYADGTPVVSVLYGIDIAAQAKWGSAPDLVISGPNEGNNLGMANNNSGTLGAAMIAIGKGVPAIAVSANHNSQSDHTVQERIAEIVIEVVKQLEQTAKPGEALLPRFTGLNVNLPEDVFEHKGFKYTRVGWSSNMELSFSNDMSQSDLAMGLVAHGVLASGRAATMDEAMAMARKIYAGAPGVVLAPGNSGDDNPLSEANAVNEGYVTISTINGNVQAEKRETKKMKRRLSGLFGK